MWPDCSSPSRLPAPRRSRSWLASWKPAPSVSSDCSACQALFRLRRHRLAGRRGEDRIGARLRAPDPAAQLIELREAEHVGAMHDQRVGAGNVEAGFDDRGRQQDVVFAVVEGADLVLELGRRELAVGDDEFRLRHVLAQERRGIRRGPRCAGRHRTTGRRDSARAAAPRARSAHRTARRRCAPRAGRPAASR